MHKVCPASSSAVTLRPFVTPGGGVLYTCCSRGSRSFVEMGGKRLKITILFRNHSRDKKFGLYIVEGMWPKYRWYAPPLYADETLEAPSNRATHVHMIRRLAAGYNCYDNYWSVSGFQPVSYALLESMFSNCYKDAAGGLPPSQSLTSSMRNDFFAWCNVYILQLF